MSVDIVEPTQLENCCLYVSNLSRNVQCEHLEEIFGTYGAVERAEVDVDKRNGASRGKGLVQFRTTKDAENALVYMNGGQIDGSVIVVTDRPPVVDAARTPLAKRLGNGEVKDSSKGAEQNKNKQRTGARPAPGSRFDEVDAKAPRSQEPGVTRTAADSNASDHGRQKGYVPKERSPHRAAARESNETKRDRSPVRVRDDQQTTQKAGVPRARSQSPQMRVRPQGTRSPVRGRGSADQRGRQTSRDRPAPAQQRRRVDSRERGGQGRGGADLSRYGPAPGPGGARRGREPADMGIYGPGPSRGQRQPYVPIDRSRTGRSPVRRSRSRERRAVSPDRGGRRRSRSGSSSSGGYRGRRGRSGTSRSRSRSPSGYRGRHSRSRYSSRSPSRSSSAPRTRRYRSRSSSSSGSSFRGRRRRSRSYSSASRTTSSGRSRSRSRSRSDSGARRRRTPSRSRSRSPASSASSVSARG